MSIAAVLLADERAADGRPDALRRWDDELTLVEYQIEQLAAAGVRDIEVVVGADAEEIIRLIARENVEPIINRFPHEGETGAIRAGAAAVPRGTTTAIIARVSDARPADTYARLIEEHGAAGRPVTRTTAGSEMALPAVANEAVIQALRNLRGPVRIGDCLAQFETHLVRFD